MRVAAYPMLAMALIAPALLLGACDRHSPPAGQAQGSDAQAPRDRAVNEAVAAAPAPVPHAIDRSRKGTGGPRFAFTGPDGKPTSLAAFKGKPVLLNLWATWCGPCVKELPTLDALAAREAGKLQVVALSQDMQADKVAPFIAQRHLATLKAYTDPKMAWVPAVAADLPTSILYDAAGKEVWRTTGDQDWTGGTMAKALAEVGA